MSKPTGAAEEERTGCLGMGAPTPWATRFRIPVPQRGWPGLVRLVSSPCVALSEARAGLSTRPVRSCLVRGLTTPGSPPMCHKLPVGGMGVGPSPLDLTASPLSLRSPLGALAGGEASQRTTTSSGVSVSRSTPASVTSHVFSIPTAPRPGKRHLGSSANT